MLGMTGCTFWPWRHPTPELQFDTVTLRHLKCWRGACPEYSVGIRADGRIFWHGRKHVARLGRYTHNVSPEDLRSLRQLLARPDFYWMPERFVPSQAGCGNWTPDQATVIVKVKSAHLDKRIIHYLGCHGAPPLLTRIEDAINATVDAGTHPVHASSPSSPTP